MILRAVISGLNFSNSSSNGLSILEILHLILLDRISVYGVSRLPGALLPHELYQSRFVFLAWSMSCQNLA